MSEFVRLATVKDCRALAYHAYLGDKGQLNRSIYDLMFPGVPGPTDERLTLMENLLQTKVVSWFHYSFCSVAEVEGQVAASLNHYDNREGAHEKLGEALSELGWDPEERQTMRRRMLPYVNVDFEKPADSMILENIAVSPKFRRRGLAEELLREAIGIARTECLANIQVGVFIGNAPAQKAYEKFGFKVVNEKRDPSFEEMTGSPGIIQMRLDL
jgi:GNAT superfamily N-acetyltransferase